MSEKHQERSHGWMMRRKGRDNVHLKEKHRDLTGDRCWWKLKVEEDGERQEEGKRILISNPEDENAFFTGGITAAMTPRWEVMLRWSWEYGLISGSNSSTAQQRNSDETTKGGGLPKKVVYNTASSYSVGKADTVDQAGAPYTAAPIQSRYRNTRNYLLTHTGLSLQEG